MLAGVSWLDIQEVGRSEYPAVKLLEKKKKKIIKKYHYQKQ